MKFLFLFAIVLVGCVAGPSAAGGKKDTHKADDPAKAKKASMKLYNKYLDVNQNRRAVNYEGQAQLFGGAKKYNWLGSAKAQTTQAGQLSKLTSYQGQRIKTDMAYDKWMDVMAKEDAKGRDIYNARQKYRSANYKQQYKMLEVNGDSYKKMGLAGLLAYQMRQVNHELQEDAYSAALRDLREDRTNQGLRRAVRKADRKLEGKRNELSAQTMYLVGQKEMANIMFMRAQQTAQHDLEYAIDHAVDEFRGARSRENRIKLAIAEKTLESNEMMETHYILSAMGQPLAQLIKTQAANVNDDIYELKEQLAFEAWRNSRAPNGVRTFRRP